MLGEIDMAIMCILRFLRRRGEFMGIKEIIEKSKVICETSKCGSCALKDCACIDKHGHVNAADAKELIALEEYLECQVKTEKKGKKK